ncbi:hypothetical protein F4802DRAFT_458163 [Xylaria palmicola]|nr:hypothetical protein F4802DRAFT_458163 [Xylaria palmicola]
MLSQTTKKLFALLTITPATLAAPNTAVPKGFDVAPFAPATPEQGAFTQCSAMSHQQGNLAHTADMPDCLGIGEWAKEHNGEWILKANTAGDDWHILRTQGTCALVVRTTAPTSVGNQDVVDMMAAVHLHHTQLGPVEEVGTFGECQGGAAVSFWLRSSNF